MHHASRPVFAARSNHDLSMDDTTESIPAEPAVLLQRPREVEKEARGGAQRGSEVRHAYRSLMGALVVVGLVVGLTLIAAGGRGSLAADGTLYVDADATGGANDGTSWGNAYTDLQDALTEAEAGDEIWVAEGNYRPTREFMEGDPRSAAFQMMNGLAIYGGFSGTEGSVEERDWEAHPTILSGDLNGDDGPDFANNGENSYHVFYHPGGTDLDSSAILDGFTISGGNADGDEPHYRGGGMHNDRSSPTLLNCIFSGNSADFPGGGLYNQDSSPTLSNCAFVGNQARHGGGIFNYYSSPLLSGCTFSGNLTHSTGGGIYNLGSSPTLIDCTFTGNSAYSGGGMTNVHYSAPTLTDCAFTGNSTDHEGGGMYNFTASPTLINCTFSDNSALEHGGGMANAASSSPMLTGCVFSGNSAGSGGAMRNYFSSPLLSNCTLVGNSADSGGAVRNDSSSPTLLNVIFSGNSAHRGGGIHNDISSPVLTNCTFEGNSADWGGGMYSNDGSMPVLTNCILWADTPQEIYNSDGTSVPVVTYSDIQGGYAGRGNIDAEPLFADPDSGDYHLHLGSPCIDAGDNDAPDLPDFDLEGDARRLDGDGNVTRIVDMGVDEVAVEWPYFRFYLQVVLKEY